MQVGKTQISHKISQCKALQCKALECKALECKTPRLIPRYLLCQNALRLLLLRHLPNAFSTRPRASLNDDDDDGEDEDVDEDHSDVDDDGDR